MPAAQLLRRGEEEKKSALLASSLFFSLPRIFDRFRESIESEGDTYELFNKATAAAVLIIKAHY